MSGPLPSTQRRLTFIDSLRGFALFGVFGANLMLFSGLIYMTDERKASLMSALPARIVDLFELFFVENKFMGLFSVLFGISFWLFLDRVGSRGGSATQLFYRRIGWLFLFGAVHGWLFWSFDILRFYALWATLLPLFLRMPLRRLLAIALCAAILLPAVIAGIQGLLARTGDEGAAFDALALAAFSNGGYSEFLSANWKYDWYQTFDIGQIAYQVAVLGRLLVGLYAARALNLGDLASHRALLKRVLVCGVIVGAVGNGIFAGDILQGARGFVLPFLRGFLVEAGYLGFTLAYAAGLALLFLRPAWKTRISVLAPLGQMALTFYLSQTLFGIWLFYGFAPGPHLMGRVGPAGIGLIWIVGYTAQVALARAWMRRFRFGPAEWLWRTLTYWRVQSVKGSAQVVAV